MTLGTSPPPPVTAMRPARQSKLRESGAAIWSATPLTYVCLIITAVLSIFPIYYMFVVGTRTADQIGAVPPPLTPGTHFIDNLTRLFSNDEAQFLRGLGDSLLVSVTITGSVVFFSSLAGFAFAKLRFRGKDALLLIVIGTMMVPTQLGIIPLYMMMASDPLQWTGELQAVIVPALVSGFGVFMMRQYADQAVPNELIEAARVDGCGSFRTFWSVVLPALRPAAAVLGLLTFMTSWNDFIWPYTVLYGSDHPTVQTSLATLSNGFYDDLPQIFVGAAVATVPLLVVFVLFGKQIIGGIMNGAVKG